MSERTGEPSSRALRADPFVARWLAIIVVVAAVVRFSAALDLSDLPYFHVPQTDAAMFDLGARRVAAGDLALADQVEGMGPGYFYVLGAVYAVLGDGPWPIRVLQGLVGLLTVLLVFDAGRRLAGARAALVPAAIAAVYGPWIFFESQLLGETIHVALHALAIVLVLAARERRAISGWLAVGATLGLAALFRPSALVLVAVTPALAPAGTRLRATLAVIAAALLAIAPITARNVLVAGEPVLITGHGGINLWVGNGPGADGSFRVPPEVPDAVSPDTQFRAFRDVASRAEGRPLGVAETDRHWTRRTLAHVVQHPLTWGASLLRKARLVLNGRELSDVYRYEILRDRSEVLRWTFRFAWLVPLALLGLVTALRSRDGAQRAVAWIACAELAALVLVLVSARYRLSAVPALLALAAVGAAEVHDAWRARDRRRLAILGATAVIAAAIAFPVRARNAEVQALLELGRTWEAVPDPERALASYDEVLAREPSNLEALERAALAELAAGDRARARARTERWIDRARSEHDGESEARARAVLGRL